MLSQILYNYFQCAFTDPGYIEKNVILDPDAIESGCEQKEESKTKKLEELEGGAGEQGSDSYEKVRLSKFAKLELNVYKTKYCRICRAHKPYRAHHCSVCNRWYVLR